MMSVGLSAAVAMLLLMSDSSECASLGVNGHQSAPFVQCLDECSWNANVSKCCQGNDKGAKDDENIFPPPSERSLHEVIIRPVDFISYKRMVPTKDDLDLTHTLRKLLSRVSYKYL